MIIEVRQCVPHPERNSLGNQFFHQLPGLGIGPEQNRDIPIRTSFFPVGLNLINDALVLLILIPKLMVQNRRSFLLVRLNFLGKTLLIILDNLAGSFHNQARTAVVRIQKHLFRRRIILFEVQHNLRLRAAETVDGLVVVAYDEQVILRRRQHPHNVVLQLIDILKFIHQDIPEFPLPGPENVLSFLQKLVAVDQHIVEIDFIAAAQAVIVFVKNGGKAFGIAGCGLIFLQVHPIIFHLADFRRDTADEL